MDNQILSVSEFVSLVNQTLEFAYPLVTIEGEVSNFKISQEKWVHFDIKDEQATVNCFMTVFQLKTPLEDGMKIRIAASPAVKNWGRFSLTVRSIELAGEGALRRAYELLKAQLDKEGLFALERKRPLPPYPAHIAVVSSAQAAGYKDFIEVIAQRWGGLHLQLANVQVQGKSAPAQIVSAIKHFNQDAPLADVLVIIRGGGSLEDLQAFNSEEVVRAVSASRIPTVVGVGHETDTSLADLAADVRAATPTDAARRVVPDRVAMERQLSDTQAHLNSLVNHLLQQYANRVQQSSHRLERFLQLPVLHLEDLSARLNNRLQNLINDTKGHLANLDRILRNVDPKRVLARGYAIARVGNKVIRSAAAVKTGQSLMVQLAKGELNTEVKDVKS